MQTQSNMMWVQLILLSLVAVDLAQGDCFMHNMRGSNNRVNGRGRDRSNANRLFDSQNNNRGGYNAGPGMKYYVGSKLMIEWTNQHTCGERNSNCELIIQYMCHDRIRDGGVETTIPENVNDKNCEQKDCNTDYKFGMHETHEWYDTCKLTSRNHRLYTANQGLRTHTAKTTRQNNNGNRRGLECPEERDYYPYWRPSPWKDVVVMTGNMERCDYYRNESQNVKDRYYCEPPAGYRELIRKQNRRHRNTKVIPITKEECEKLTMPESTSTTGSTAGGSTVGVWTKVPAHNIAPPECVPAPKSRDNHNGNGEFAQMNNYNWTIPDDPNLSCVMRIRYNISTNDFHAWDTTAHDNTAGNQQGGPKLKVPFDMNDRTAEDKGYYIRTNPVIEPFRVLENGQDISKRFKLKLAFNTAQFGRTFQDRSHAFSIIPRPEGISETAEIVNLGVRGKRGNIVQTYPAMEYDYVPNRLNVTKDTFIHIQWTGSNNNPGNNAGQGTRGTDRNNICLMAKSNNPSEPADDEDMHGRYGVNYPADLRNGTNIFGLDDNSERDLCSVGVINGDNGNGELNEAFRYYNHKLVRCKVEGVWHYMCTRNNNFTNRSQKGRLTCNPGS